MERIRQIIGNTPFISDLQRRFYLTMLTERKRLILDYALTELEKKETGVSAPKRRSQPDRGSR